MTRDHRKKGREGRAGEEERESKLAGMASTRAARQQKRRRSQTVGGSEEDETEVRRRRRRLTRKGTNTAAPRKGKVTVELPCTVRSLSEATGVPTAANQRTLLQLGKMLTINQEIDPELAELVAAELNMEVEFHHAESLEEQMLAEVEAVEDRTRVSPPAHSRDHLPGARRSWKDVAAGPYYRDQCRIGRSRGHHAAHSGLQDRQGWPRNQFRRYAGT